MQQTMNKFKLYPRMKFNSKTLVTAMGLVLAMQIWLFGGTYFFPDGNKKIKTQTNTDLKMDQSYTTRDVVDCLDTLFTKRNNESLHIAFIGDSLVRNQYIRFLKMIPGYDRRVVSKWSGFGPLHQDHSVTHQLLNGFKVSFLWKPVINDGLLTVFKKWNIDDFQVPSLIFLGVTVHHMLDGTVDDDRSFEQILEIDLLPLLRDYLAADTRRQLIWLYQPVSLDKHVSIPHEIDEYPQIHFQNIRHYNENIRRLLEGTRIMQWNFDSYVEEYIRSCALVGYKRKDRVDYFLCKNNFHPGLGLTFSFLTQLLFKHVCNCIS